MTKFDSAQIKVGMRFSKPVFFDDGVSMFIESGITVKPYHLVAISRWSIPFLLTDGRPLGEDEKFVDKDIVEDDSPTVAIITSLERLSLAFSSINSENSLAIILLKIAEQLF